MQKRTVSEKGFQTKVVGFLKTLKGTWFFKCSDRVQNGIPDIIACIAGRFVALELKRSEKAKVSPLQTHILGLIEDAHGFSAVVYPENWLQIKQKLLTLSGGTKDGES